MFLIAEPSSNWRNVIFCLFVYLVGLVLIFLETRSHSLCSPGWPGPQSMDQASFERDLSCLSLLLVLWLNICATTPNKCWFFFNYLHIGGNLCSCQGLRGWSLVFFYHSEVFTLWVFCLYMHICITYGSVIYGIGVTVRNQVLWASSQCSPALLCFSWSLFTLLFEIGSHTVLELIYCLDWVASKLWGILLSTFPILECLSLQCWD